jgi:hypothetical protein
MPPVALAAEHCRTMRARDGSTSASVAAAAAGLTGPCLSRGVGSGSRDLWSERSVTRRKVTDRPSSTWSSWYPACRHARVLGLSPCHHCGWCLIADAGSPPTNSSRSTHEMLTVGALCWLNHVVSRDQSARVSDTWRL